MTPCSSGHTIHPAACADKAHLLRHCEVRFPQGNARRAAEQGEWVVPRQGTGWDGENACSSAGCGAEKGAR
jgi:hypothetical protein